MSGLLVGVLSGRMTPHNEKRDGDHRPDDQGAEHVQNQSLQNGDGDGDGDSDNGQHEHTANPAPPDTNSAPDTSPSAPAPSSPPPASSLLGNGQIPSPTFQVVSTTASSKSGSSLSVGTVYTPVTRSSTHTLVSQQAGAASSLVFVTSPTRTPVVVPSSIAISASPSSLTSGTNTSATSIGMTSTPSAAGLSSTNATPFGESTSEKSTNAPAVIAGSIFGVLAVVLIFLFAIYRKRTISVWARRDWAVSNQSPRNADPEMATARPSIMVDASNPGPLQRNPPNEADFFAFNLNKEHRSAKLRSETPENLSTVMEETSPHSGGHRNSQDSFPTPLVAQAVHLQPAATTNADDIPLPSSTSSPLIIQTPEFPIRSDSRSALTTKADLPKPPAARKSARRNRDSTESIESASRFRTVDSWVCSQAKRLNLPSVQRTSRQSERTSSVPSEAFPQPPVPPKFGRISSILRPGGKGGLGQGYKEEVSTRTAMVFRQHPGEEVRLGAWEESQASTAGWTVV